MAAADKIEASKRIVEETRRLYAALLARPPDERQLARPTFKFIQDLVRSLMAETRILRDVFNPADLEVAAAGANKQARAWDRRARLEFVQKLIDYAANNKQPVVGCVAAKVVAGAQPNKTNELLQSLARLGQLKASGRRPSDERRPQTFTKPTGSAASRRAAAAAPPTSAAADTAPSALPAAATTTAASSRPKGSEDARRRPSLDSAKGARRPAHSEPDEGKRAAAAATGEQSPTQLSLGGAAGGGGHSNYATFRRSAAPPQQQQQQKQTTSSVVTIASEADIGRNVQRLRGSLARLRALLAELGGSEELLRESLRQAIGRAEALGATTGESAEGGAAIRAL